MLTLPTACARSRLCPQGAFLQVKSTTLIGRPFPTNNRSDFPAHTAMEDENGSYAGRSKLDSAGHGHLDDQRATCDYLDAALSKIETQPSKEQLEALFNPVDRRVEWM